MLTRIAAPKGKDGSSINRWLSCAARCWGVGPPQIHGLAYFASIISEVSA